MSSHIEKIFDGIKKTTPLGSGLFVLLVILNEMKDIVITIFLDFTQNDGIFI